MSPASFILSEEVTIAERNQMGLQAQKPDWLDLRRGMDREEGVAKAGECRILLTKQLPVAFGGITDNSMTSDTEYPTVKAFIYKEGSPADESCYTEWEALWDDDAVYQVASVINW